MRTGFEKMEASAKKVGIAIAAAFSVQKIIAFGKDLVKTAADAEVPWNRLANTLANVGIKFSEVERAIKLAARAMQDTTTVDGEAFAQILDELVAKTGDFNKAMKAVPLVADVAAKFFNNELGPATDLIGKLLVGNTRGMAQFGMAGKTAAESLAFLAGAAKGAAENELNTFWGKLDQIGDEWNDIKENAVGAFARMISGSGDAVSALEKVRVALRGIADFLGERGQLESRLANKKGQLAMLFEATKGDGTSSFLAGPAMNSLRKTIQVLEDQLAELDRQASPIHNRPPVIPPPRPPGGTGGTRRTGSVSLGAMGMPTPSARGGLIGSGVSRGSDSGLTSAMGGGDLILHPGAVARIREGFADIEHAGTNAAFGISGAFQDSFGLLLQGFDNVGEAAEALGRGITGALLGGVAQYASAKIAENVALSFEEVAKGLAAAANPFLAATAPLHFAAAAKHAGTAALWGVLAGGAGAGQSAVAGGGRGGRSGGIPSGASDGIGRTLENNGRSPQTIIYVDGFNPQNPVHVRTLTQGIKAAGKSDSSVEVRPRGGR